MEGLRDRFKDAKWYSTEERPVLIGGAGGIGSWLSLFLARAGMMPIIYDYDIIETHNIGGQFFRTKSIGKYKVEELSQVVKDFTDIDIFSFNSKIDENSQYCSNTFSAFDNMKARHDLFSVWSKNALEQENNDAIFIDGRLELEQLQIFCVTKDRIEDYKKTLFDDSEVEDLQCTLKQTSHTAAMIASHMTAFFTNHLSNIKLGKKIREVPFKYEYVISSNFTETI